MDQGFTWIAQLDRLSNGDITKFDEVCDQPYRACLNLLLYWMKRDEYQEAISKYNSK